MNRNEADKILWNNNDNGNAMLMLMLKLMMMSFLLKKNTSCFAEFDQTYDCPEEILNSKARVPEPVPVFYVLDDPYPESISSTFGHGENVRGRPDGNIYDEPEVDLTPDGSFIVMDSPSGMSSL